MSEIKYGWAYGGHKGVEMPVTADQYFHRQGGHFVVASAATGYATVANATNTTLFGYAEVPKDTAGYSSWKSSSTTGADKVFVITDPTAVYAMPCRTAASVTQALVGDAQDIVMADATYTLKQYINVVASKTSVLIVDKVDVDNDIVYVKINPAKLGR
jgi:electron transfer flavoprotein alpha subunit